MAVGQAGIPRYRGYNRVGDLTRKQGYRSVGGHVRRTIAHALTFHGVLPSNIDHLIDEYLPADMDLMGLHLSNRIAGWSLSFTVYSLKQMIAAGTISVSTAWHLFNQEWQTIEQVDPNNVAQRRTEFLMRVRDRVQETTLTAGKSLLEFEFWARAGEAGLAQFERYGSWAEKLVFERADSRNLLPVMKEEYRHALWLEMRIIEGQVGIAGTNKDVAMFILSGRAQYYSGAPAIECSIDLFDRTLSTQFGSALDSGIKAEIGHWMFDLFDLKYSWVSELMDRMNVSGYTQRVNQVFDRGLSDEQKALEWLTFLDGGYFLSSREFLRGDEHISFPVRPMGFPPERFVSKEKHEVAEYVEREIRRRLVLKIRFGDRDLEPNQVYQTYRKIGLYIALLNLEQPRTRAEILKILDNIDLTEVEEYYANWRRRAFVACLTAIENKDQDIRIDAAASLSFLAERQDIPVLEQLATAKSFFIRTFAAKALLRLEVAEPGSARHTALIILAGMLHSNQPAILSLGQKAVPILAGLLDKVTDSDQECYFKILEEIGGDNAVAVVIRALQSDRSGHQKRALGALCKMRGLKATFAIIRALFNASAEVRVVAFETFISLFQSFSTRLRSWWQNGENH